VVITGSGSAFPDPERGGASATVIVDGAFLQFDLGRRSTENMMTAGFTPTRIDYVFLTHHHFDHIANYGYFLISTWIAGRQKPIHVFGPPGTEELTRNAFVMQGSDVRFVQTIVKNWLPGVPGKPSEKAPYIVKDVDAGVILQTDAFKVTAVRTAHYPANIAVSLAYRVDTKYGAVVISGDTAPSDDFIKLAEGAELLVHECQRPDSGMVSGGKMSDPRFQRSNAERPQTGHTTPLQLGIVAQKARVGELVVTHLPPYTSVPAAVEMSAPYSGTARGFSIWGDYLAAIKRNYPGPVTLAEDGMIFNIEQAARQAVTALPSASQSNSQ
jgi:ribonuclease Z